MAIKILEGEEDLDHNLLDFFLKGNLSLEKSTRQKPFDWFPDQVRRRVLMPEVFPPPLTFSSISSSS
jgi:dynein heavy chain